MKNENAVRNQTIQEDKYKLLTIFHTYTQTRDFLCQYLKFVSHLESLEHEHFGSSKYKSHFQVLPIKIARLYLNIHSHILRW